MASIPLIAIVGRPNVGKSSLFNRLSGRRQAITHETAGTTRDANYATVDWNGRSMLLVDTAGLHKADDEIEVAAQEQIQEVSKLATVIVLVVDAGIMITNEDRAAARLALKSGKPVVLAINKIDTAQRGLADEFIRLGISPDDTAQTSAIHGGGSGDLLDLIVQKIPADAPKNAKEEEARPIRLALLGRPNVGKSSILNSLTAKQSAIVSNVAGTTRDVTSSIIKYHGREIEILDTAGLRRRGKIEAGIEKFSSLRTLAAIREADICVIVIDATELSVAGDQHIAGLAVDNGKGVILVVNKWDAVEEKDDKTMARYTRRVMTDYVFMPWAPLVFTSATQGLNVTKLFELTREIFERRHQTIPTGALNKVIERLTSAQPPAGLKGKRPKINYGVQVAVAPPTFAIYGTYPELVHFSYRRYLENGIRKEYDYTGTPINIEMRNKRKEDN